jgi:hypothetical protein
MTRWRPLPCTPVAREWADEFSRPFNGTLTAHVIKALNFAALLIFSG